VATAGAEIGFPAVLKALAPGVAHKHDHGLVITGIADEAALKRAYMKLEDTLSAQGFARAKAVIILQPMRRAKAELIIGVSNEPRLGHFLLIGLGGVFAEVFDQVTLMPIPLCRDAMRVRVAHSTLGALLTRLDKSGAVIDQVLDALEALQCVVLAHGDAIESIDVNPLLADDSGCMAVDALVVLKSQQAEALQAVG
jgi:hypothetical protein